MNWSNDNKNTQQVAPYDPSRWATPPPQGDRVDEGNLILVDENGNQVGALGEHINVAGVVPGSQRSYFSHFESCLCQDRILTDSATEPVEIDLSRTDGVVTVRTPHSVSSHRSGVSWHYPDASRAGAFSFSPLIF